MTALKIPCFTAVKQGILRISECSADAPCLHHKALLADFGWAVGAGGKSEHLIVWADDDTFIDD